VIYATAPVSWGVDFAGAPGNPPWRTVLDGIAATGLTALELGPVGYLPESPDVLRRELAARGLTAIGSFVFEPLHDPAAHDKVLATARRAAAWIAAAGGRLLVIIDRAAPDARPAGPGLAERVAAVAEIARDHGLEPVLHPHTATAIETGEEIEAMLAATGLGLCLDTGHLTLAGLDPVEWAARPDVRQVHLKDIDPDVAARKLPFWDAVAAGVFCPIGTGAVDFAGVLAALAGRGYDGAAVLEQDRRPGSGDPAQDVRRSLAHLRAAAR
jgi:inosose dehydratase